MSETLRPLIQAAQAGDRAALEALAGCVDRFVRIFSGSLSQTVRRACGSTMDFVLEGLADAMARLGELEYRSDGDFYAWVASFVRHRIIDAGRREGRKKRAGRPVLLGDGDVEIRAWDPTASAIASAQEVRIEVGRALVDVQLEHPQEMEAVVLKVFEEHTWTEVKQAMGLSSEKRARTLVAHGLELLRPRVESALGPDAIAEFLGT